MPDDQSVAARAWGATKAKTDPDFENVASDFREKLNFAADRVQATGVAISEFEVECQKIIDADAKKAAKSSPVAAVPNTDATEVAKAKADVDAKAEADKKVADAKAHK